MRPTDGEALRRRVEEYCAKEQISGALRVTVRGEIAYRQFIGYANDRARTPFTDDSIFTLYSLSKPFCAIGLLRLADLGLVDLDAHPKRYVPEADGFPAQLTVRHLLHHTSGLPDFGDNERFCAKYAPGTPERVRAHLRPLAEYPCAFAPGTGGKYSNVNFVLCALIIENVAGEAYAGYMKRTVFEPFEMPTAVVDRDGLVIARRVTGYELRDGARIEVERNLDWLLGAGDIAATADDVYRLNIAYKERRLLRPETWEAITTPSPLNGMGMGCTVSTWHGKRRITHNGGHTGFRTLHVQLPEDDLDIIFLSNSGYGSAREAIAELVWTAFYGDE